MILERLAVGSYAANCYIIADQDTKEAIVVDPGGEADRIYKKIESKMLDVKYIVLTHGHGDHIGAVEQLKKLTSAKVLIHHDDGELLEDASMNLTINMNGPDVAFKADETIGDDTKLTIGKHTCEVIHTPGHTKGGICLYFKASKILFSGDTLCYGSIGRTDLYGGNHKQMISAIKDKLLVLEDDVTVYPGHGASTTIGFERKKNPFL